MANWVALLSVVYTVAIDDHGARRAQDYSNYYAQLPVGSYYACIAPVRLFHNTRTSPEFGQGLLR